MRSLRLVALIPVMLLAVSCGGESTPPDSLNTRTVTLPNGKALRCEVMIHPGDIMRGMMFRDSLAPDRGMLFIHDKTGNNPYWMYQVRIPLDIIWMDKGRKIVEIAPDTPPCKSASSRECPQYGGNIPAQYVLELAGGAARKEGLKAGDVLQF